MLQRNHETAQFWKTKFLALENQFNDIIKRLETLEASKNEQRSPKTKRTVKS
jgi:hypothetical protein